MSKAVSREMKILIISETDDLCGPIAAAFLHDYSPFNDVVSAGCHPSQCIDPMAVDVMKECLVDLSGYQPKEVSDFNVPDFDAVYKCPERPRPVTLDAYRELRDFIKNEAYLFFRGLS